MYKSSRLTPLSSTAFLVALLPLLSGCGLPLQGAPGIASNISLAGRVHGGQSPIQNAVVKIYHTNPAATSYGSANVPIAATTSDVNGDFTFSPSANGTNCPAGDQVYVTAAGGYQSGQPSLLNSQMLELAALGDCSNVSANTFVVVNELTTVAAAYALSGFITTSTDISNPSLYQANINAPAANSTLTSAITPSTPAGLIHAFTNAANLVNPTGGSTNTTVPLSIDGVTLYGNVPVAELNTLADILQSCVDSASTVASPSTACTTLFGDTPSLSGVTPTNTLQSLVYLARNPYPSSGAMSGSTSLLSLAKASAAFQPILTASPSDWTIAISWFDSVHTPQGYWGTLDENDTFYFGAAAATAPASPVFGANVYGLTVPSFGALPSGAATRGVAVDNLGNLWVSNYQNAVYRYSTISGGSPASYATASTPIGIAVDKNNNIWIGHPSGTTTVAEIPYNASTLAWAATEEFSAAFPGGVYGVNIDAQQNIWAAPYYSTGNVGVIPNSGTASNPQYTTTTVGGNQYSYIDTTIDSSMTHPWAVVLDASGNGWFTIYNGGSSSSPSGLEKFTLNSGTSATAMTGAGYIAPSTASSAALGSTLNTTASTILAIDGADTIFLPDLAGSPGVHVYATQASAKSAVLSPSTGLRGCYLATPTTTSCPTYGARGTGYPLYTAHAAVIDSTGSLWTNNYNYGGLAQTIGVAAPTYPLSAAGMPGLSPGLTSVNPLP